MRIALAQVNTTVGDIEGNLERCCDAVAEASAAGADLVLLPELALCGYPPEDLAGNAHFVDAAERALDALAARAVLPVVAGLVTRDASGLRNTAALLAGENVRHLYHKRELPNYGVFDEERYFKSGSQDVIVEFCGVPVALTVCEDVWIPGTMARLTAAGARVVLNISASPFHTGKGAERERMLQNRARDNGLWLAYCNLVGGQDELVFDGRSVVISPDGEIRARGASFDEDLVIADIEEDARPSSGVSPMLEGPAEVYRALTVGLGDYVRKNGFAGVTLGLSGGLDSALVATIAADALGPARVHGVLMPGPYSSEGSLTDARKLAANLGIEAIELPITGGYEALLGTLAPVFGGAAPDTAEENLQARVRGTLLMALSNRFGWLVLTTGNKSELSVGYSTLYGDMAGGFSPIKDVFKTAVYDLALWRNAERANAIPETSITKAPSAELRPNQVDQDSLPPYEVLDAILAGYIERDLPVGELIAEGHDEATVREVVRMTDRAEHKRRQSAPGTRVTPKAFGRDRRMPITNRFGG